MAKKIRLDPAVAEVNAIIGIASQLRDYRLVHFINKHLGVQFASVDDLPYYDTKAGKAVPYPMFWFKDIDLRTDFCLLCNSNGTSTLIPSLKQLNFFLLIQGGAYQNHIDEMVNGIRRIQGVQAAIAIAQSSIKEIGPLLEDIELHILDLSQKGKNKS
jgi:hypothetical protein